MSDYSSLRPPASPSGRASSPVSGMNPTRYSMGKQPGAPGSNMGGPVKSPSMGNTAMPTTPHSAGRILRPSSELVGMQHQGTPESDAIDKWFEDLRHYEATLEEMAAASLDQNFKEELSAIEQWFRVLSEAERTAALYSLLQESTQVQIRFFITVLQQMAQSDPMSALLSPAHPNSVMAEQMEAKLASLGLKSPSAAMNKPGGSAAFRQSSDAAGFLSPNAAALYNSGGNDAAAVLAAQRAKFKANRISAPGTLAGEHSARNFSGGNLDQVQERNVESPAGLGSGSAMRPKSTDGLSAAAKSPRPSGPLDDQLSPITNAGNWSSMLNTPIVPMFGDDSTSGAGSANVNMDAASAQLAGVADQSGRGVLLDQDVPKYRRRGQVGQPASHSSPMASPNIAANSPNLWHSTQNDFLRQAMATSPMPGSANSASFNLPMSPNALAGLQSPSGGLSNPMNMQMMNAMAAMGGLGNMSAAQFLQMQQQILHNQQQIAAMAAGGYPQQQQQQGSMRGGGAGSNRSAPGSAFQGLIPNNGLNSAGRRSPGSARTPLPRSGGGLPSAGSTAGVAGPEEDVTDLKLLQDIPAWLRVLRLHKYTPNFEHTDWKEIVVMSDKDLDDKGVAALGARRKMLKTFEAVREKHGIPHPPGSVIPEANEAEEQAEAAAAASADGK